MNRKVLKMALKGLAGTILEVDLSNNKIVKKSLSEEFARKYLGGRGFNSKKLFELIKPGVDALSPENVLMFAPGCLSGTLAPSSDRFTVTAKSPLTDIFGDSNSGGGFASELKFAGYDQIIIFGKSEEPVYLWIDDDRVEIRDAKKIWGKSTWETISFIKKEIKDSEIEVVSIGQAGENMVRYAAIMNWHKRAAGRTGMGAVMGSKNLKAIAVRGTRDLQVAHPHDFEKACREAYNNIITNPSYERWSEYGTPLLLESCNELGMLGTRNYETNVDDNVNEYGGIRLKEKFERKMRGCLRCPIHCTHFFYVDSGEYKGEFGDGPEFGLTSLLGNKCGISNLPALLKMNNLCNQYGIDVATLGSMVAWAMDCYQRGIISNKDTDGINLEWGDHHAVIKLIHKVAHREGFGNILAEGEKRAPEIIGKGSEKFIYHCKGLSYMIEDPRSTRLFGSSYFTSTRGGDHLRALATLDLWRGVEPAKILFNDISVADPLVVKGKGRVLPWFENFCAVLDAAEICKFTALCTWLAINPEILCKLINSATGMELNEETLLEIGERIFNLEKAFNSREGLTRKDDLPSVPEKILKEPLKSGPGKGRVFEIDEILDEYYQARGWDKETGLPKKEKLEKLGLGEVIPELEKVKAVK
jgi:aldehyde:ferredoxin oxidoreductase